MATPTHDDDTAPDALTLGRRLRHLRKAKGLTLDALGTRVGVTPSLLSLVENGRREPRLALLRALAEALDVTTADLLDAEPPSRRAALEIALDRAQRSAAFGRLALPSVRPSRSLPLPVLEQLVGLHDELTRRDLEAVATPEEARRANTQIRLERQARDNYLPEIEKVAEHMVRAAGYSSGALTHRTVSRMAEQLGFAIIHVDDLPASTRTITDLEHGRIYLPPASIPGGHGLRSLALQAIAHRVLGHERPTSYDDFLRQRMEITYFASSALMPESATVEHLQLHKREKDLAIEDLRDAFGVTHEAAAQRFTSLATHHLDIPVHFLRIGGDGAIYRAYANDGLPLPTDVTGAIEGQLVCRSWGVRRALARRDRTSESYQYTDTPAGTFWCSTQTGSSTTGQMALAIGVPFASATWFRGRDTTERHRSTCPDEGCCRRPSAASAARWQDASWPSARIHQQVFTALPTGAFPGVDAREVYAFLDRHAPTDGARSRRDPS
ncbi:helix-turn-helix transcriptional regulator [Cellulomonas edaphi]|uniref:Helix-turn-helix domain-containing protein n=1 Tax=Cellulomonas edaphi TaxID=3053468 RepID=A0ABT7S7M2_9CELL|nr:XRE family transcriptional regulator [Cellulomons edaphi]MDM7831612.1 helix-turn-helix domain-containing protein [Cellulomons edaphi]